MQAKYLSIMVTLGIVLVLSLSGNIYSFKKLANNESERHERYAKLLEEKEKEISDLQQEVLALENQPDIQNGENTKKSDNGGYSSGNQSTENLKNTARRFIEYTYNVNSENYVTAKQNASHYMTDELTETLFPSDGLDESQFKSTTKVSNIHVYLNSEDDKKVIVSYDLKIDYKNGYVEKRNDFVLLHMVETGGIYKVKGIEPINNIGGV